MNIATIYQIVFIGVGLGFLVTCNSQTNPPAHAIRSVRTTDPAPDPSPVQGIDVSHHSGEVSWTEVVSDGVTFGLAKSTEGVDYTDPKFSANWREMKAAKIIRGAYHFYVVDDDPVAQAQNFIQNVHLTEGDLPPVVDVETAGTIKGEALGQKIRIWLETVESHFGIKPIIYTTPNFWNDNVSGDFSEYHLWISNFGTDVPRIPDGFSTWLLWQYQENAAVAGVASGADLSILNAEIKAIEAILLRP